MSEKNRTYESPRQRERQAAILDCARAMLDEKGYAGLTMRDLAERAGVAPATLYNLYGGKDELIVEAVHDLMVELGERAFSLQQDEGLDSLLTMGRVTAGQIEQTPHYAEAMVRALFNVDAEHPLVAALFASGYPFTRTQLEIAQQRGDVRPEVNVDLLAKHMVGDAWGQIMLWLMGLFTLTETVTEHTRNQLLVLIGVTQGEARERLEAQLEELGWD